MNPGPLILVTKTNRFETALQPFNAISEVRCRMAGPAVGTSQFGFHPEIFFGYAPKMPDLD
jgi:hypothetical protein